MQNTAMAWLRTHRYCMVGLYLPLFLLGFLALEIVDMEARHTIIHCPADDWIPFIEWFVIPYVLWYAWVPAFLLYFMFTDKDSYLRLCFVMFTGMTVCLAVYALWPNGLELRGEIDRQNFCSWLVQKLRAIDPPRNVCPSIHVSSTVSIYLTLLHSKRFGGSIKAQSIALAVSFLICISTLFIKQHSIVDVLCGWALSCGLDLLWRRL